MRTRKTLTRNRRIAAMVVTGAVVLGTTTACYGNQGKAPAVGQNVYSVNQLQNQGQNETITGYNITMKNPLQQYPATQMSNSLELQALKERDLYLNDSSKIMYIYIFPSGRPEVFFSSVRGKVASMSSEMTPTDGVYGAGQYNDASMTVPIPQDDLSYGGTEFGDNGIFWFDEQGGFHEAGTAGATVVIESAPLSLKAIELPAQPMDSKVLAQLNKK